MTKNDLINVVAEKAGTPKKTAEHMVNAFCEFITDSLSRNESVTILGFGKFETQKRQATVARNPKTGESVHVPETCVPKFKPGLALKDAVKAAHKNS